MKKMVKNYGCGIIFKGCMWSHCALSISKTPMPRSFDFGFFGACLITLFLNTTKPQVYESNK